MNRCTTCGSQAIRASEVVESTVVGSLDFDGSVQGWVCEACGETYVDGLELQRFEGLVAHWLADRGEMSSEAFRFMRKSLGMPAVDLAGLLGVTPETLSHWETGKHELPRHAAALLATIVIEHAEGRQDTIERMRNLGLPEIAKPRHAHLELGARPG